jgi:transposase
LDEIRRPYLGDDAPFAQVGHVRELQRLLGKKTLEAEILKEALEHATGSKKQLRLPPSPPKDSSR